jgi:hypothetical protein
MALEETVEMEQPQLLLEHLQLTPVEVVVVLLEV